jgi:hypothetical protein
MRKAIAGILIFLLFSASLFCLSSTVNADEDARGYSNQSGADIQPFDYSDRAVMNPANTYSPPENGKQPGEQATGDADSDREPSQRPPRFGADSSSKFLRSQYGR